MRIIKLIGFFILSILIISAFHNILTPRTNNLLEIGPPGKKSQTVNEQPRQGIGKTREMFHRLNIAEGKNVQIEFCAKCDDHLGAPLAGVKVTVSIRHWKSIFGSISDETTYFTRETDSSGLVCFPSTEGDLVTVVMMEKTGYVAPNSGFQSFAYSPTLAAQTERPSKTNPALLTMYALAPPKSFIDFSTHRVFQPDNGEQAFHLWPTPDTNSIHLIAAVSRSPAAEKGQKFDWSVILKFPIGGLMSAKEIGMMAPENGYRDQITISFDSTSSNWSAGLDQKFYLRTALGAYGYMRIFVSPLFKGNSCRIIINGRINSSNGRSLQSISQK